MNKLRNFLKVLAMIFIFIAITIFQNFATNGSYDMSQIAYGALMVCIGLIILMLQSFLEH